jgi:restriction system protein
MNIIEFLINAFVPVLVNYWWLFAILVVLSFLETPFMKGVLGEFQVNLLASLFLDKRIYRLLKNITLPTEYGTTQIDHVVVSKYGVFVIETKNIKGWIFGSATQKKWTQKIYRYSKQFQNPLHQNYKHTKALQEALNLEAEKLFSLVVFIGDSTFKTPMPDNVVYAASYIRFIKSKSQVILTDQEVDVIAEEIQNGRLKASIKTHVEHVRHVKQILEQKQVVEKNTCPRCGKSMVLRAPRNGQVAFWGCSAYPRCRGIQVM